MRSTVTPTMICMSLAWIGDARIVARYDATIPEPPSNRGAGLRSPGDDAFFAPEPAPSGSLTRSFATHSVSSTTAMHANTGITPNPRITVHDTHTIIP